MTQRYRTPLPASWFMAKPGYLKFMIREATSVLIAAYVVYLLLFLHRLGQGAEAYAAFVAAAKHPIAIVLHLLALVAALFHSVTWFNLTPKIMPMYKGEERIPDALTAFATGYLPWIVASAVVLWGALAGTAGGGS